VKEKMCFATQCRLYALKVGTLKCSENTRSVVLNLFPTVAHYRSGWWHRDPETFVHKVIPITEYS